MRRIRPVTNLLVGRLRLQGTAIVNGGQQESQGQGTFSAPRMQLAGAGQVHVFVGSITGSGALATKKFKFTNGNALAIRHSVSTSASTATKKAVVAGAGVKIVAAAAVVQLLDVNGNPAGYGPSEDPNGVFFGDTSLVAGDVWWPTNPTSGVVVTPFAGGTFHSISVTLPPGTAYSFTVNLRRAIGGVRSSFTKNSVLS